MLTHAIHQKELIILDVHTIIIAARVAATAAVELIFGYWLFRPAVTPEALLTGVPIPKKQ